MINAKNTADHHHVNTIVDIQKQVRAMAYFNHSIPLEPSLPAHRKIHWATVTPERFYRQKNATRHGKRLLC
jgi:hypothetical protein